MYIRRRMRVNPPVKHQQRPPSHRGPFKPTRPAQAGLGDATRGAGHRRSRYFGGIAHPGTRRRIGFPARRLTSCQHGECSWCVDARSTSCASPALPVVSALGTCRSSAPDHPVDARPLGSDIAERQFRQHQPDIIDALTRATPSDGHRPKHCHRGTDRRNLERHHRPGGVRQPGPTWDPRPACSATSPTKCSDVTHRISAG